MPVLKRRSKIVSFRLSDEEYDAIMAGCISQGSRSLSEFTRSVAFERATGARDSLIQRLNDRVEELDRVVRSLSLKMAESRNGNGGTAVSEPARPITALACSKKKEG